MQKFAINGGLLNGDPEVWIDAATASVSVQAAGVGMRGSLLNGAAQVRVGAVLALAYMAKLSGSAGVRFSAVGQITYGRMLAGDAKVQVKLAGNFTRWAMLEGLAPTEVIAEGDIGVSASIGATFSVVLRAGMAPNIASSRKLEGFMPIFVKAGFQAYSVPATQLAGKALVQLAAIGRGNLFIASPPGFAAIRFNASADSRFGAKLSIEGAAVVETFARGDLKSWHYVYAEGAATVSLLARAEIHGTPIIPGFYVEAPVMRALRVSEDNRRFTVPAERRA